jgi:hypothetical protein
VLLDPAPHVPGRHCASSALRDLAHFHGHALDEAACFGLAAGLGFLAFRGDALSPTRHMHGRSATLEANFFRRLGVDFRWHTAPTAAVGWDAVRRVLDGGDPVLVQADLHYLAYYRSKTHFSGHVIAVWGYDESRGEAYVGDTQFPGLQAVPLDELALARTSQAPPHPLESNWFPGRLPTRLPPLDTAMIEALAEQACVMLAGEVTDVFAAGVDGMAATAAALPTWAQAPDASWCARFAYQVIERRGTGGGNFRLLYRDFLEQAGARLPSLAPLAPHMGEIAAGWTALAMALKDASEAARPDFRVAASLLGDLATRERAFWSRVVEVTATP